MFKPTLSKIAPYMAIIGPKGGFIQGYASNPKTRQFIVAAVETHEFKAYGTYTPYHGGTGVPVKMPSGHIWWEDGMGSLISHEVYLVSDDSPGIYVFYEYMNDPAYTLLLGKLKSTCPLYGAASAAFRNLALNEAD